MTFNVQCFGRVSSSANLSVRTLQDGTIIGAPGMYTYISATDTVATIAAADYFASQAPVLNVGDFIHAVGSDTEVALNVAGVTLGPPASVITVQAVGIGDVDGPAGATDNALVRFDGVTGKLIQNGIVLESDLGDLSLVRTIENASGLIALPSYTFTGDTDSGLWRSAANTLDLSTNAFRVMQWAAAPALSVNYHMFTASATTVSLKWTAVGTDANISLEAVPKGTGAFLNAVGAIATPSYSFTGDADTGMWHSGANTIDFSTNALRALQLAAAPAASVNYLVVTPQATNAANAALQPTMSAAGTDAVIDVAVSGKGATGGFAVLPTTTAAAGSIKLWNGGGTFYTAWQSGNVASNQTYTTPTSLPSVNGMVLSSTTAGVQSWVSNSTVQPVDQTSTPVTPSANTVYSANTAGLLTFNMPATAAFGDVFEVVGQGAGGWLIQMNAGQTANLNGSPTSVAGSLASTNRYNCIKLFCTVANTTFTVVTSSGVITVA